MVVGVEYGKVAFVGHVSIVTSIDYDVKVEILIGVVNSAAV
jgi:hypothetical protein